ncbi:MAG: glycoside hydrolase family 31 protein [Acidobacteriaceae bacterium]
MAQASDITPLPSGIEVHNATATIRVTAIADDVLRVQMVPEASPATKAFEHESWAVVPNAFPQQVQVQQQSDASYAGFSTDAVQVKIHRKTLGLTVTDLNGQVITADDPTYPVEFHGAAFQITKSMPADEHYFGLGDKAGPLDRRNEAFTLWNTDAFHWQESTDPLYKSIPFFLGVREDRSYGIFLDDTWRSNFDFGKRLRNGYSFGAEGGPLDYYIFYGPSAKHVLARYTQLTGRTPMPPLWTLGFQQSRYSYYPESQVKEIAAHLRADKIPADAIYLDIDYQQNNRPFTVDPKKFPTFPQMIKDLALGHFHIIAITDLHIADLPHAGYAPYDTGMAGDHFLKNPDGSVYVGTVWPGPAVFPDFSRKATSDWWGGLYKTFYSEGIGGFWNDMNEPSIFDQPTKTMPLDVVHRIDEPGWPVRTATHAEMHNVYGMLNSRATYEGLLKLKPDQRPFVLTRATYAGGQRYAATWTGDNSATWNHLRMSTADLLNLGLSGFAMAGDDIGGFADSPQPDLLTRWLELGAFNPIYRDHAAKGTRPHEPWVDGPAQEAIRRRYIEWRYRLLPYLYTAVEENTRDGMPVMRPLFLEFPAATKDKHPLDLDSGEQFLFGRSLMVAPQIFPDTLDKYSVLLPPGGWYDFWTGGKVHPAAEKEAVSGLSQITIEPKLDLLPVYVRAGSILPLQPLVQSTEIKPQGALELRVYPGPDCQGSIYQDDGISFAYKHGDYLRVKYSCESSASGITLHLGKHEGSYIPWWKQLEVVVYGVPSAPKTVTVDGRTIQPAAYDAATQELHFRINDVASGSTVAISH